MGIPAFFRWIVSRSPSALEPCLEGSRPVAGEPSFDALYIDTNGLVHVGFERAPRGDFDAVLDSLYNSILRIVRAVRPSRLLYVAFDGVAPCAKMVQQRQRRFDADEDDSEWCRSMISPGTAFMFELSRQLLWRLQHQLLADPQWRGLCLVYSDSSVPGEGEHKIVNYIREARASRGYDPSTRHCVYGNDADQIVLGLATHEPRFSILRDHVDWAPKLPDGGRPKYTFLHLDVVRESIAVGLPSAGKEESIADFVFICIFVGNDFLPALPGAVIKEGGLDELFAAYRPRLATGSRVDWQALAHLLCPIVGTEEPCDDTRYYGDADKDEVVTEYLRGLCWVLEYYTHGKASWTWYYPFDFAPRPADVFERALRGGVPQGVDKIGSPLSPYAQLLLTLPPRRAKALLPPAFHPVLCHPASPLHLHPAGGLPDIAGVESAVLSVLPHLSEAERKRNEATTELLVAKAGLPVANPRPAGCLSWLKGLFASPRTSVNMFSSNPAYPKLKLKKLSMKRNGIAGSAAPSSRAPSPPGVVLLDYKLPPHVPHRQELLKGQEGAAPVLSPRDMRSATRPVYVGPDQCFACGARGHFARDCEKGSGAREPDLVCYSCGKPGHYARECPQQLCYTCGAPGHYSRDCPGGTFSDSGYATQD
eukprot:Sspe_Gene.28205::Locus_12648_Transcript_1_2_Confidence_0.750_Length_3409::g.28205::m.28205/K20553/XRN4; 5'-3' exoribonuclease 4